MAGWRLKARVDPLPSIQWGFPITRVPHHALVAASNEVAVCPRNWEGLVQQTLLCVSTGGERIRRRLRRCELMRTPAVFSLILKCLSARANEKVLPDPDPSDQMWIDYDDL